MSERREPELMPDEDAGVGLSGGGAQAGEASAPGWGPAGTSRVLRFDDFSWSGVERQPYKDWSKRWKGVVRHVLVGEGGEDTPFHVRYFEVEPGGYTMLERHEHQHAVIVIRGGGSVRLGERTEPIEFGDVVYVAPGEPHQFRADDEEKLGFLCVVSADRDKPEAVTADNDHDNDDEEDQDKE